MLPLRGPLGVSGCEKLRPVSNGSAESVRL